MKLLFISSTLPPVSTAESVHTALLCRHLAAQGIDVHLLTTKQENLPTDLPCTIYPIMQKWDWSEMGRMARCIRRCNPDVVLLMYLGFMYRCEPMITFAPTLCKRLLPRQTRFVTQFENFMGSEQKSRLSHHGRRIATLLNGRRGVSREFGTLLKDSDHLIFLSANHLAQAQAHRDVTWQPIPIQAISSVIPAPPLMQGFASNPANARCEERAALGLKDDTVLLLYYGYLYAGKGIDTLLLAFQQVSARHPNARLIIVGGTTDYASEELNAAANAFRALPTQLGIEDRVIWTGHCDSATDRASRYMYAADIAVLPFDFGVQLNNSSLAVLAWHNLPVITTRGDNLEPEFKHKENIYICPPKDPGSMANGLEEVITDGHLRRQLTAGIRQMSRDYFSWDKAIEKTLSLLTAQEGQAAT